MPVDKFGRNGDRSTPVYTGINLANLANSFLRKDEGNTAIGTLDKCGGSIVKSRCCKNYVDKNASTTDGDVLYGNIKLSVDSDLVRSLGCNDLTAGKMFTLLLGQTQIC